MQRSAFSCRLKGASYSVVRDRIHRQAGRVFKLRVWDPAGYLCVHNTLLLCYAITPFTQVKVVALESWVSLRGIRVIGPWPWFISRLRGWRAAMLDPSLVAYRTATYQPFRKAGYRLYWPGLTVNDEYSGIQLNRELFHWIQFWMRQRHEDRSYKLSGQVVASSHWPVRDCGLSLYQRWAGRSGRPKTVI